MRKLRSLAAGAAVLMVASGCGLTDEQPRPGVAVEVAGRTLELSTVDDAVADYCSELATIENGRTFAVGSIRADIARSWVQAVGVEELADELGVDLPDGDVQRHQVEEAWEGFGELTDDNYESFELLTWIQQRLSGPLEQIGSADLAQRGGAPVVGQPALDQGVALLTAWLAENDPEFNPVFGDFDPEQGSFSADAALSVPVSDEATSASATSGISAEQIAALPRSQQCGPPAEAGGAPQA